MKRSLPVVLNITLLLLQLVITKNSSAQSCTNLTASWTASESRCKATGTVVFAASGGSGNYNYSLQGPVNTGFTSSASLGGLPSGTYTGIVKDIVSNCTFTISNIVVAGSYAEPRFGLTETDVSCANGNDGTVSVTGLTNGLAPYSFTLVAPSAMGVGTTNSTGLFNGLVPGTYSVQMLDSCGAIQTRTISVQNYSWSIYSTAVVSAGCTNYNGQILLRDSKGNFNSTTTAFNGFMYGWVIIPGDTTWATTFNFPFDLGQNRNITLVAMDRCGLVQSATWSNTAIPSVGANVNISTLTCTGFNATVMNPLNLTSPQYCLVDGAGNPVPGQPCNTSGAFTNIPYGSYCMQITNSCYDTVITRCFSQVQSVPAITGGVALSAYTCTGATSTVTGQHNLTNPQYCIVDGSGNAVPGQSCNATGVFTNVPYGSYTINVTDGCTGTVLSLGFSSGKAVKSVASVVALSNNTCSGFNAKVNGATNLISPQYCLSDSLGNVLACNSTGVFDSLGYGSYCVNITDACGDTTIQRCFHQYIPLPTTGGAVLANKTCTGFDVSISGQANVFNGQYCLQDSAGNPVSTVPCNSTGVFTNIPYGSYCIMTTDGCSGGTSHTCFTAVAPVESVGPVTISNKTCAGFTATLTGQKNLSSPTYCLFDSLGNAVGSCNATGIFSISNYGSYSIQTTDGCSDTVFNSPFGVIEPVPSVSSTVNFSNQSCTSFTATIAGQTNLTNPHYYLKDSTGNVISDNGTGRFDNISYGSYCIDIADGCGDTTIERCFTTQPNPMAMTLVATASCTLNATDVTVNVTAGFGPYTVAVYDLLGNLMADTTASTSTIVVRGLPKSFATPSFKVVLTGTCGTPDTAFITAKPSKLNRTYTIVPKCPSSAVPNGSGDLDVTATSNLTPVNLLITAQDGSPVSISYSFNSGSNYTFSNLDAGTYVVTYTYSSCSSTVSDTVVVPGYSFPALDKSAAYQCNDNSFTISAAASGGIGPFEYQIIGSEPATPDVSTAQQNNPLFSINTGTQYSLIRLRAIDACGNSALSDVDILPLQNTIVTASLNCIDQGSTLSVNPIPNASYQWYYKTSMAAADSILVGTDTSYTIDDLTVADTGVYVNHMSINSGCLTQLSYFHLDGSCNGLFTLPLSVNLTGRTDADGSNMLNWLGMGDPSIVQFVIQRAASTGGDFITIATVNVVAGQNSYSYTDLQPPAGKNYYRLYIIRKGNAGYSNVIALSPVTTDAIAVYPNPATTQLNLSIEGRQTSRYLLSLYTATGQCIYKSEQIIQAGTVTIPRTDNMPPGGYLLKVDNADSGASRVFKVRFQ